MANFDYDTQLRRPEISGGSSALAWFLLVAVIVGLLALFGYLGIGGGSSVPPGEPGVETPAASAPDMPAAPATNQPVVD